jgi:hypothetical protein
MVDVDHRQPLLFLDVRLAPLGQAGQAAVLFVGALQHARELVVEGLAVEQAGQRIAFAVVEQVLEIAVHADDAGRRCGWCRCRRAGRRAVRGRCWPCRRTRSAATGCGMPSASRVRALAPRSARQLPVPGKRPGSPGAPSCASSMRAAPPAPMLARERRYCRPATVAMLRMRVCGRRPVPARPKSRRCRASRDRGGRSCPPCVSEANPCRSQQCNQPTCGIEAPTAARASGGEYRLFVFFAISYFLLKRIFSRFINLK